MRRVFAGGFIVSSLQIIWKCTVLITPLLDPTYGSDIKTAFIQRKNGGWNEGGYIPVLSWNSWIFILKVWPVIMKILIYHHENLNRS